MSKEVNFDFRLKGKTKTVDDVVKMDINFSSENFKIEDEQVGFEEIIESLSTITEGFIKGMSQMIVSNGDYEDEELAVDILYQEIVNDFAGDDMTAKVAMLKRLIGNKKEK